MTDNDFPLQRLLDSCIEANAAINARHADMATAKHIRGYHCDCRTIRLDIGIRSGKSAAIIQMATEDDVVLVGTDTQAHGVFGHTELRAEVKVLHQLMHPVAKTYKRIWVDEPSMTFRLASPGFMYEMFSRERDQLYILLGQ